jgi:methionyl-tRNA formyltransferase
MELAREGVVLAGVLTNPDSPRGRGGRPEPTDVSVVASLFGARGAQALRPVPQLKPEKLDALARKAVAALKPDLLVSFAYGRIFGPRFLSLFPFGGINIHPSLLPKFRGATPIPAVILACEQETGVTIQKLAPEMDAGDILAQEIIPLTGRETTASLSGTGAQKGAILLKEVMRSFIAGTLRAVPQEGAPSFCSRIAKEDGLIDWTLSAVEIDAHIRAYTPWPLSWTSCHGVNLFILEAAPYTGAFPAAGSSVPGAVLGAVKAAGILVQTGSGILAVTRLQHQAKKPLDWKSFLNGAKGFPGSVLGI